MKRSRLEIVLDVLHGSTDAALGTQAQAMPGYPFVTSVPFVLDERHRPVILVSTLAEHTRNLAADPRASLMVRGSGKGGDVARATLVGCFEPVDPPKLLVDRYKRYQPEAEAFLQLGDFGFRRMQVERIRTIGGFGQAGWLEGDRLRDAACLTLEDESELLVELQAALPPDMTVLGLDLFGIDIDYRGKRTRRNFAAPCTGAAELLARALPMMDQTDMDQTEI